MSETFAQLGLPGALVDALARNKITEPFPVQAAAIPDALDGRDVLGKAPTGSGKTLAFGLPLLANVKQANGRRPRALILAPTRELAEQIKKDLVPLSKSVHRHVFAVYGGVSYGPQKAALRKGVDVLVATPGRLEDLIEQGSVSLGDVDFAVIDEADRMADMGFLPAVRRILDMTARRRQTLLFSATLDGDVAVVSRDYQHDPVRHEAASIEPETSDARHHFWLVRHDDRVQCTVDIVDRTGRTIVFTRTRHGADRLAKQLTKVGMGAVAMHGGRSQNQRTRALQAFSSGRAQALIATDVAARGIHVDDVASVIHFDPPADHKDYLHRSGRTARAGASGAVVSLVTGEQRRAVKRMQRDLDLSVPISGPEIEELAEGGYLIGEHVDDDHRRPAGRNSRSESRSSRPRKSSERFSNGDRHSNSDRDTRDSDGHTRSPRNGDDYGDRKTGGSRHASRKSGGGRRGSGESLYVANLPWSATEDEVTELFRRHGNVQSATIITDRRSGRSRGFGFVEMASDEASSAVSALNGAKLNGRELTVRIASPPAARR